VEETGVVLFIDQHRMKIMPQVSTITIEEKNLIPAQVYPELKGSTGTMSVFNTVMLAFGQKLQLMAGNKPYYTRIHCILKRRDMQVV
jgi:hypothetical protein